MPNSWEEHYDIFYSIMNKNAKYDTLLKYVAYFDYGVFFSHKSTLPNML